MQCTVLLVLLMCVQALASGHLAASVSAAVLHQHRLQQQLVRKAAPHPGRLLLAQPLALPCMQHTLRQALLRCCRQGLRPVLHES